MLEPEHLIQIVIRDLKWVSNAWPQFLWDVSEWDVFHSPRKQKYSCPRFPISTGKWTRHFKIPNNISMNEDGLAPFLTCAPWWLMWKSYVAHRYSPWWWSIRPVPRCKVHVLSPLSTSHPSPLSALTTNKSQAYSSRSPSTQKFYSIEESLVSFPADLAFTELLFFSFSYWN